MFQAVLDQVVAEVTSTDVLEADRNSNIVKDVAGINQFQMVAFDV